MSQAAWVLRARANTRPRCMQSCLCRHSQLRRLPCGLCYINPDGNCRQQLLDNRQTRLLKHCRLNGLLLGLVSRVQQALFHQLIDGNQQCVATQSVQPCMQQTLLSSVSLPPVVSIHLAQSVQPCTKVAVRPQLSLRHRLPCLHQLIMSNEQRNVAQNLQPCAAAAAKIDGISRAAHAEQPVLHREAISSWQPAQRTNILLLKEAGVACRAHHLAHLQVTGASECVPNQEDPSWSMLQML